MRSANRYSAALPHLPRMRARPDVGNGGLTVFCALFASVVLTSVAHAAPVSEVSVKETANTEVRVRVVGASAPTFQVFRLPGRDAFAVELPGADLSGVRADVGSNAVLLQGAQVERSGTPRVVIRFHGEVDYDASTKGNTLEVVFRPLGDKSALRRAAQDRRSTTDARNTAQRDLQATSQRVQALQAEQQALERNLTEKRRAREAALADLSNKAKEARAQLANLEKRRADEVKGIAKLAGQRASEAEALATAKSRTASAEKARAEVQKQIAGAKQQLASVRDEVRLAKERSELTKVQAQRAAEEKRLAASRAAVAAADKALVAKEKKASDAEKKARAQAEKLAQLERRSAAEQKRLAAAEKQRKGAESKVAALLDRQTREQDHLSQVQRQADQAKARLATLETKMRGSTSRLAAADTKLRERAQRLQNLDSRVQRSQQTLASAEQRLAQVQKAAARPAATARPPARPSSARNAAVSYAPPAPDRHRERITVARPTSDGQGFGGSRSVDINRRNRYQRAEDVSYDNEEPGRGQLSHITVRRASGASSQVGVRVDGGADYSISRTNDRELVLTLYDTRAANLDVRRILDARDLGSSVLRVLPRIREGRTNRVELTIELRDAVPVKVGADEAMLWVHIGEKG